MTKSARAAKKQVAGKSARRRGDGQRQSLSRDAIVETALKLVRRLGAAKLSMRTLAAELGVTPMAIYYHVPDKDHLLDLLAEAVFGDLSTPEGPDIERWQDQLKAYVIAPWLRLSAYPGLAAALIERPPPKSSRDVMRHGVSILTAAGFDRRTALLAIVGFHTYMFGVISMQVQVAKLVRRQAKAGGLSEQSRPQQPVDFREIVDIGVDSMIAGLEARLGEAGANAGSAAAPGKRSSSALS